MKKGNINFGTETKTEAMENYLKQYKKLYRFAAPLKSNSFIGYFLQFMEKSDQLPAIKINMSVKKNILNLEVFCNTNKDFEAINRDIFYFFKLGKIKNFFIRYYDLENGRFVINPTPDPGDNRIYMARST